MTPRDRFWSKVLAVALAILAVLWLANRVRLSADVADRLPITDDLDDRDLWREASAAGVYANGTNGTVRYTVPMPTAKWPCP